MTETESASGAREDVERLAEDFVARRRRGERPAIEEYVAAHPHLATAIRELFSTLLIVEELGRDASGSVSATAAAPEDAGAESGLQQVGEYRILREIGRGGMGVVYEAEQASLGRRVALKVLPLHSLLDPRHLERFRQEARAAARLSHPSIVPVYGVGEHLGLHYYVMQFIPGQGLNRVIEEVRRLREAPATTAGDAAGSSSRAVPGLESGPGRAGRERYFHNIARLARDAALALDYAHGEGILHRDVKPSNLLLDPAGRVWLTDFGLAKAEGSDELTGSGDFVGTLRYMAPECFKGWADPRSDVYALGVTLYELLVLQPAFAARDRASLLRRVAGEDLPAPRRIDRAIPRDLETIVLKATVREPAQRYESARAMSDDLQRFLDGRPLEARRSRVLERLGRWCARNPLIATLGVLVLLLLVTVAILSSFYAVRLRGEHTVGQRKLRSAYLAEASALRASARPGRRFEALEALRRAAAIEPGSDLVDEALACLALVDLRLLKTWSKERDESLFGAPDGTTLALVRPGGEIVLRSAADGREGFRLPPPEFRASFSSGRFSPDGRHLAVRREGDGRCEWEIWDLDRRLVCAQMKDAYAENCIAFAPDGRWVALGTGERALRLLDLETGAPIGEDVGRGWGAHKAAVHPAGRLIAFSSDRRARVHVYDREWGEVIRTLSGTREQRFEQVAWHPDGRTLAAASRDHMVYLWNAETGEPARLLQGHWAEVIDVSFHPRRALLVSRDWSPTVRFWEPGSDRPVFTIHQREGYFAGDQRCFTERYDGVDCWELTPAPRAFTLFGHSLVGRDATIAKHPHAVALAPGGRLAASGGDDGVRLWDLAARREAAHLDVGRVESVFFDASGGSLYASGEGGLQRWPVRAIGDGRTRIALGPSERLSQRAGWQRAALSHDGRKLAAVHERRRPYIFDAADPERATALSGPPHHDLSIALSADGAWAAAGTFGNWPGPEVWLWDLRHAGHEGTGGGALEPVRELHAPRAEISFHPASTHLATCTPIDCTLWRLSDGEPAWRIERERGMTFPGQVAFDRGGTFAAVSYNESTVWLVEAASGRKLGELAAPEPMKLSALALEGGKLVAATSGRRIHVWDLNGLQREIAGLGLSWAVPLPGEELEDLPPLRVAVADGSTDLLLDAAPDLGGRQLFRPMDEGAFLPELVSCAQIDRALAAPRCLIGEGEKWTYFRGVAEPSPALEWTLVDHDDTHWARGRSPLSAWPPSAGARATFLADQEGFFTTLYARCAFDVDEPAKLGALALAVEVEDGFVAYLNGEEVGRAMAGLPGERLGFRAVAPRSARRRWTEPVAIPPSRVRAGRNVLAIQVLSYGLDSRLHLLPVLAAVPAADVEGDRRRTANLAAGADGRPDASLLAYREGRILERAGRTAAALEAFERASALDRGSVEPLLRRLACHRALGEPEVAEALAREAIAAGSIAEPARLWRAWHHAAMVDLALSPARAVALLPREPAASRPRLSSHYRALLEGLAARGSIRINAGGGDVETGDGRRWSSDRFFLSGHSHDLRRSSRRLGERPGVAAETPEDSERWFPGTETFRRGYSIPLPPGRYHVTLHLRERTQDNRAERVFDVLLEGRLVPANGDCGHRGGGELGASPRVHCADWTVADGTLDLDFLAHSCNPGVCAIEIEMDGATEGLSSR